MNNRQTVTVVLSYDKDQMISDKDLDNCYDGDITKMFKEMLEDDGKFEFIDWFEIEEIK